MASRLVTSQRYSSLAWRLVLLATISLSGCAMCQSDCDHYYPAYGGRRARADMVEGRVGSILDPALETAGPSTATLPPAATAAESEPLLPQEAPLFDPSDSFWEGDLPADPEPLELDLP